MRPLSRAPWPPTDAESGESLIELMITVAIMGFAMVTILAGIWTTLRVADLNSKTSSSDVVLRDFAETLKQPDPTDTFKYVPCTVPGGQVTYDLTQFHPAAAYDQYDVAITKIRYLSGYNASNEPTWANACPATDLGLQELTLTATGPDNNPDAKSTETVTVVKRDARDDVPLGST
jgi:hypothetical protein